MISISPFTTRGSLCGDAGDTNSLEAEILLTKFNNLEEKKKVKKNFQGLEHCIGPI